MNRSQLASAMFGVVVTQAVLATPVFGCQSLEHDYQNGNLIQPDGVGEQA